MMIIHRRPLERFLVWLTKPKLVKRTIKGDLIEVQRLLLTGVDVDIRDRYGRTALMEACRNGDVHMVQLLLDYGADSRKRSFSGKNAFRYAATLDVLETLRICDTTFRVPWLGQCG